MFVAWEGRKRGMPAAMHDALESVAGREIAKSVEQVSREGSIDEVVDRLAVMVQATALSGGKMLAPNWDRHVPREVLEGGSEGYVHSCTNTANVPLPSMHF